MQYSGTFAPQRLAPGASSQSGGTATAERPAFDDPIQEARDLLRQAAHLPFSARFPGQWSTRFTGHIAAARGALRRHIARTARPGSTINRIEAAEPRLHAALERQREEHTALSRQVDELYTEANLHLDADIWRMIDLGERAILLEMALARHHNRLARLLDEATNRELGGEAG